MTDSQVLLQLLWLLPTFAVKEMLNFQLMVSENKDVISSLSLSLSLSLPQLCQLPNLADEPLRCEGVQLGQEFLVQRVTEQVLGTQEVRDM